MTLSYRKKLIEVGLPLVAINAESAREKSIRHGHPSTLHLWWARRPLAACRAVLFSSLVDDPDSDPAYRKADGTVDEDRAGVKRADLFNFIEELVMWDNSNNADIIRTARAEIARCVASRLIETGAMKKDAVVGPDTTAYDLVKRGHCKPVSMGPDKKVGRVRFSLDVSNLPTAEVVDAFLAAHAPPVLDPFCGGGSIPLEAQRLGLRAYASDLNPVPVLITKALIEIPPKFAGRPPVNPEWQNKSAQEKAITQWQGAQGLAEDVRYYGKWMRDAAEKRIGHLYPKVKITQEMVSGSVGVFPGSAGVPPALNSSGQDGRAPREEKSGNEEKSGQDGRAPRKARREGESVGMAPGSAGVSPARMRRCPGSTVVVVARVSQRPAPAGSSISNHDSRLLRAWAKARSVPTVGFDTLPVSSFESVARSMPDRSETSERLNPWRLRSARSAASALANSGSITKGGTSSRTLRITSCCSAWPSGVAR